MNDCLAVNIVFHVALNDNLHNQKIKLRATNLTSLWKIMGCSERMGSRSDHFAPFPWIEGLKFVLHVSMLLNTRRGLEGKM